MRRTLVCAFGLQENTFDIRLAAAKLRVDAIVKVRRFESGHKAPSRKALLHSAFAQGVAQACSMHSPQLV